MRVILFLLAAGAGAAVHPTVFMTPADVDRGREMAARVPWAKQAAAKVMADAATWLAHDDAWYRSNTPASGAAFAYGFTGCPICRGSWGTWGGVHASFDNPGHVTCANGHMLPDAEHPDPGTGYVGPDKRIHYFAGSYNAWVVETFTFKALDSLVAAYSLTGDEKYASKAAVILDALAAVYPDDTKGSWDYPSTPPSGRFNRPWYQVARVLIHFTDQYDQIYNSRSLDEPSIKPRFTRRRNIEENMLRDGAAYCYKQSQKGALNNGEADYIRGALAVGVCLGIREYVDWAVDGPFGIRSLAENNLDRDGAYFETSSMYADHTRGLYFTFLEPLLNFGLNLWNEPKLKHFFELHNTRQMLAGHTPRYGDSGPDVKEASPAQQPFDGGDYDFLERLYARSSDPAMAGRLAWYTDNKLDELRGGTVPSVGALEGSLYWRRWLLFHGRNLPTDTSPAPANLTPDFLGQKGLAILRSGPQAVLMRFGPSLNHGHKDDLNINYVARGREVTYDLGYGLGSTHTQVGWAKETASHNVVVVNERSQLEAGYSGGSLHMFATAPGLQVMEASSESSYVAQGVTQYRRTIAMIGEGESAYLVDLFRVDGGTQHDWMLHAPTDSVQIAEVSLGAEEPGSLAGREIAWGDKQLNDGDIDGQANKPYWNPPPGNGYGFLMKPRRGVVQKSWSADWKLLRAHFPADEGVEILTALAPGIYPHLPKASYVVLRRRGENLSSRYAAALDTAATVDLIERMRVGDALALKVARRDGGTDYVFSSTSDVPQSGDGVVFAGRFALARVRAGKLESLALVGTTRFRGFGADVSGQRGAWRGAISAVQDASVVTAEPPPDVSLNGRTIVFRNPAYSRTTAYRIVKIERSGGGSRIQLSGTVSLGKGIADQVGDGTIVTSIPHEFARSVMGKDSGFFQGKRIRGTTGGEARVKRIRYGQPMTLELESSGGIKQGETFYYYDLQAGDQFEVLIAR